MARIQISLPEKFGWSTVVAIRMGDINRGIHVSHVAILSIMEEARAQFWISHGYTEQVNIKSNIGFIVGDVGIVYKKQANYGQKLKVEIEAADFTEKSFDLVYRISDSITGVEAVRAKTGLLLFDYTKQSVIPVPDELKRELGVKEDR
jgi:acyl-CoA thioester hydrolase